MSAVAQLADYRKRRTVRRAAAWLLVGVGVASALAELKRARDGLEWCIRKAAELLPDDVADE